MKRDQESLVCFIRVARQVNYLEVEFSCSPTVPYQCLMRSVWSFWIADPPRLGD